MDFALSYTAIVRARHRPYLEDRRLDRATEVLIEAARSFDLVLEDTSPPRDGFLDARGLRMHYLDWGQAGKLPILFL